MTNRNRPASRGKAPLMAVWGIERRRVSNLGIQSRKDNGGKKRKRRERERRRREERKRRRRTARTMRIRMMPFSQSTTTARRNDLDPCPSLPSPPSLPPPLLPLNPIPTLLPILPFLPLPLPSSTPPPSLSGHL